MTYNKVIKIDPNNLDAYFNRGDTKYYLKKDYDGALADYNKIIEIDPNNSDAYIKRGYIKYDLNDINGACLDWSKAGELGYGYAYELIKEFCN